MKKALKNIENLIEKYNKLLIGLGPNVIEIFNRGDETKFQ
jgi:hypothetical protein